MAFNDIFHRCDRRGAREWAVAPGRYGLFVIGPGSTRPALHSSSDSLLLLLRERRLLKPSLKCYVAAAVSEAKRLQLDPVTAYLTPMLEIR